MNDLIRLFENVSYKALTRLCGEEELPKSGKKIDIIKRLVENLSEEKLRAYLIEFMGIGTKIAEHGFVSKHKLMNEKEIQELLLKLGIKRWQLPKILDRDPLTMLLGAKPGDIIEMTRKSQTAGEAVYYRLVMRSGV